MNSLALIPLIAVSSAFGQVALNPAEIAKRVLPAVVVIQGKTENGEVLGSGFVISRDGKVATNLHVIRNLKIATVHLANGEAFDSISVLATDTRRDLAIIQIAGFNLDTIELGDSDAVAVGEPLLIVGSPRGLERTVTAGILSAVRDEDGFKVLQTDAAVNPGNSGGPLLNSKGQVIGVVSFKLSSSENLNFAIPINYVRGMMNNLQAPMTLRQMQESVVSASQKGEGPSLKETLDWLKEKLPLGIVHYVVTNCNPKTCVNGIPISIVDQATAWSLDSCSATFGDVLTMTTGATFSSVTQRYTTSLGLLSGHPVEQRENNRGPGYIFVSGEADGYYLFLTSKTNEIALSRTAPAETIGTYVTSAQATNQITLIFNDRMLAERVLQAFDHAAELCRVREPF